MDAACHVTSLNQLDLCCYLLWFYLLFKYMEMLLSLPLLLLLLEVMLMLLPLMLVVEVMLSLLPLLLLVLQVMLSLLLALREMCEHSAFYCEH